VFEQGRGLLRQWFDAVETQLAAEAARAGIFRHSTIVGGAREEVVRRVLRDILPRQIEVGSGKVIGADCQPSKQIDIVIFDGRYPVLRMGDDALYPVEGVIATIEVKSELNEQELRSAMINAQSVMKIQTSFIKEDADEWLLNRVATGVSHDQAFEDLQWRFMPYTYVLGFDGLMTQDTQARVFAKCFVEAPYGTRTRPMIPSVIVGGAAVTVAISPQITVAHPDDDSIERVDPKVIAITFESSSRFGILASHLLLRIDERNQLTEPTGSIRRTVQSYLPLAEYVNDRLRLQEHAVTIWNERPV
jgi:hypothetical protein